MSIQPTTRHLGARGRPGNAVDRVLVSAHEAALIDLRGALAEVAVARARSAPYAELRELHAAANLRFADAAAAAQRVYDAVIAARGGGRRAVNSPEGQRWDAIVGGLRTAWEQQRMRQSDDRGSLPPNAVRIGSRAPWAPHQAGMEFDPPDIAARPLASATIGVAFPAGIDAVPRRRGER